MQCHKQAPRVLDWNMSNSPRRWRPILPLDWKQSSRELMMVKWGQTTETSTEGGRQGKEGGKGCREANVITLSLVHCCLLSDLIWSRRHTWGKAHPSQVLQNSSLLVLVALSILPFPPFSVLLSHSYCSFIPRLSQSLTTYLSSSTCLSHYFWFQSFNFKVVQRTLSH